MALPIKHCKISIPENCLNNFKNDILHGLSLQRKQIPSVYFYDAKGSLLFNLITKHPDYYLTKCDLEILKNSKHILASLLKNEIVNLIEFGPGEGIKTSIILEQLFHEKVDFTYIPIDVSDRYLSLIKHRFTEKFPKIKINPKKANYLMDLEHAVPVTSNRNFVLFLGSNIGNFDSETTSLFFDKLFNVLNDQDLILIGFDLCKNVNTMLKAYNDSDGITRAFNLNLLARINNELQGNFVIDNFSHYGTYNVDIKAMESYLISLKQQEVMIGSLNKTFKFQMFEPIHVEYSHKYTLHQIHHLAMTSGFEVVDNFLDSQSYFVNSLWRVNKNLTPR